MTASAAVAPDRPPVRRGAGGELEMLKLLGLVPTRNRPRDVERLIESLNGLEAPDNIAFRINLVDNSEDGDVRALVENASCQFPIRYIHEPRPGLSRARNAGLDDFADDEVICTIDDDIILPPTFLADVRDALARHPDAGMLGGRVELYDRADLPLTIKRDRGEREFRGGADALGFLFGCCMIIPAQTIRRVGLFDERIGAGTPVGAVEDADFVYRVWKAGKPVFYTPNVWVYHNHGRRTREDAVKLLDGYMLGHGAFYAKYLLRGHFHVVKWLYWWWRREQRRAGSSDAAGEMEDKRAVSDNPVAEEIPSLRRQMYGRILVGAARFLRVSLVRPY